MNGVWTTSTVWISCGALVFSAAGCANDEGSMTPPLSMAGTGQPTAGPSGGTLAPQAGTANTGGMAPMVQPPAAGGAGGTGAGPEAGTSSPGGGTGAPGLDAGDAEVADAGDGPSSPTNAQALPPTDDYAAAGPFSTTMESSAGPGGRYTIFRPDPLGADGFLHPPIIFGPGIITTPAQYRTLLTHLASHGYVTICVNSLTGGPNAPGNLDAMREGLDWLLAQNAEAGDYQGKLAVERAVTMGYSIGSTASVQLSSHEAIATTVAIHGHSTSGDPHGPVLLLTGTQDVIGDVRRTLTTLEEAPAMLAALPIGHLNVLSELSASGRYIAPITAWLRYWLNGDEEAKRFFWGDDCAICGSPWITPETNAAWDAQTL